MNGGIIKQLAQGLSQIPNVYAGTPFWTKTQKKRIILSVHSLRLSSLLCCCELVNRLCYAISDLFRCFDGTLFHCVAMHSSTIQGLCLLLPVAAYACLCATHIYVDVSAVCVHVSFKPIKIRIGQTLNNSVAVHVNTNKYIRSRTHTRRHTTHTQNDDILCNAVYFRICCACMYDHVCSCPFNICSGKWKKAF